MKLYIDYVNKFDNSLSTMNECKGKSKVFMQFLERARAESSCRGRGIDDFLIMPVQRIPRYSLLLKELLKNTEEKHRDYGYIKQAFDKVSEIGTYINERKRDHESKEKVNMIQQLFIPTAEVLLKENRTFIQEGEFFMVDEKFETPLKPLKKKKKEYPSDALGLCQCHLFLFNDILLLGVYDEKKPELLVQKKKMLVRDIKGCSPAAPYGVSFYEIPETTKYHGFLISAVMAPFGTFYSTEPKKIEAWCNGLQEQVKAAKEQFFGRDKGSKT